METTLYCATSKTTGKMYVGITRRSVKRRWASHCASAKRGFYGNYTKFHKAIAKRGPEDFEVLALYAYPTQQEAAEAEIYLIAVLDLTNSGYNCRLGGALGAPKGQQKRSPEFRALASKLAQEKAANPEWIEKMRQVAIERSRNPEYRAKLSKALTGRKHSPETREKLRAVRKNRPPLSAETKERISAGNKGKRHSPETIERMRKAQKGRIVTEEMRRKISESLKGRKAPPRTPEHCQKIAEAKRRYWAQRRAASAGENG